MTADKSKYDGFDNYESVHRIVSNRRRKHPYSQKTRAVCTIYVGPHFAVRNGAQRVKYTLNPRLITGDVHIAMRKYPDGRYVWAVDKRGEVLYGAIAYNGTVRQFIHPQYADTGEQVYMQ